MACVARPPEVGLGRMPVGTFQDFPTLSPVKPISLRGTAAPFGHARGALGIAAGGVMSETLIAVAVLPLLCFVVVLVEWSRLTFTRLVERQQLRSRPTRGFGEGRSTLPRLSH